MRNSPSKLRGWTVVTLVSQEIIQSSVAITLPELQDPDGGQIFVEGSVSRSSTFKASPLSTSKAGWPRRALPGSPVGGRARRLLHHNPSR